MARTPILRGSNRIINRPLEQSDGSDLPVGNIILARVQLIQFGAVVKEYTFGGGDGFRAGADAASTDLELTAEVTAELVPGPLTESYYFEISANVFVVDAAKAKVKIEFTELEIV